MDHAEAALEFVLNKKGVSYKLNPGDGAFYGPKIDFHIQDSKGRSWQCGTIQLDFQMPEKFECSYVDEKNENQTPILIHRAIFGAIERFMAILIEHYEGAFPFWLAPVQAVMLPIHSSHGTFAESILKKLEVAGIRVNLDDRNEKFGLKIREAQKQKIPYMLVIGDKEVGNNLVSVRNRKGEQKDMTVEEFIRFAKN
ncbi:His/Gly/Thr/Pro-type tRNA ligase C-terminal domain-containing protein [Bacillus sp. JCM 19041]|uniref:His/Gly/Thr/Pro-type tRNA ligase C-terminal domain-containing protein n=1 Tax=Bacillus sp. JCM 19041 TaxID=1460637 RepID=UPI0006D1B19B